MWLLVLLPFPDSISQVSIIFLQSISTHPQIRRIPVGSGHKSPSDVHLLFPSQTQLWDDWAHTAEAPGCLRRDSCSCRNGLVGSVCWGSISDHPPQALASLQPMEVVQRLLRCTHTAPSSSELESSFPIAGHSWLTAHSPAPLWEPSLKRAVSPKVTPLTFPGQCRTSDWPHCLH